MSDFNNAEPRAVRRAIAAGEITGPTAGMAAGFVQANLVIVPETHADDFGTFCESNRKACPLIDRTRPGNPSPPVAAPSADLRTDVPRYRVFRHGLAEDGEPTDIRDLWRDVLVGFLLGCSFTFESALREAGLGVRHLDEGRNVPMYRTNIVCQPSGRFRGPMVVSMRPYRPDQVAAATEITARYPHAHGVPIHVGDPGQIGIADLSRPDYGDAVTIHPDEIPIFWACGVTPQLALETARIDLAITHSPGCMFLTDLRREG